MSIEANRPISGKIRRFQFLIRYGSGVGADADGSCAHHSAEWGLAAKF